MLPLIGRHDHQDYEDSNTILSSLKIGLERSSENNQNNNRGRCSFEDATCQYFDFIKTYLADQFLETSASIDDTFYDVTEDENSIGNSAATLVNKLMTLIAK